MSTKKRAIRFRDGRVTSVSVEDEFWNEFRGIARRCKKAVSTLTAEIRDANPEDNLSRSIRLAVLRDLKQRVAR